MTFIDAQRNLREKVGILGGRILCLLGEHELTSDIEEGIKPSRADVEGKKADELIRMMNKTAQLRCKRKGCRWTFPQDL